MTDKEIEAHVTKHWSFVQVKALVNNWGKMRSQELAPIVGKGPMACIGKANRMGLDPIEPAKRHKWQSHARRAPYRYYYQRGDQA